MITGLYYRMRDKYFREISKYTKPKFEKGEIKSYRYGDELFFSDKNEYEKTICELSTKLEKYWNDVKEYSLNDYFPQRYQERKKMLLEDFLPLFDLPPVVIDIGCASGDWAAMAAPMCKQIDGYDYSKTLIDTAKDRWKTIDNIHFYQADARKIKLNTIYDAAMILGMMMYIDNDEDMYGIFLNISNHLQKGGYLYISDTVNCENFDRVFLINKKTGYNACYHSKEEIYKQLKRAGFVLKKEKVFDEVKTRRLHFDGLGTIWEKK